MPSLCANIYWFIIPFSEKIQNAIIIQNASMNEVVFWKKNSPIQMETYNFMYKTCLAGHNHIFPAYHLQSFISAHCLWSKNTGRYTFLTNKWAVLEKLTVNQSPGPWNILQWEVQNTFRGQVLCSTNSKVKCRCVYKPVPQGRC